MLLREAEVACALCVTTSDAGFRIKGQFRQKNKRGIRMSSSLGEQQATQLLRMNVPWKIQGERMVLACCYQGSL